MRSGNRLPTLRYFEHVVTFKAEIMPIPKCEPRRRKVIAKDAKEMHFN